jgi:hypothetical protein
VCKVGIDLLQRQQCFSSFHNYGGKLWRSGQQAEMMGVGLECFHQMLLMEI